MIRNANIQPSGRGRHGPDTSFIRSAGLRVIDTTHVLAGPFAAYQLAVLGADVIKVELPSEPDQARASGLPTGGSARRGMGTAFHDPGLEQAGGAR